MVFNPNMSYRWTAGSHGGVSATDAAKHIGELEQREGTVTAKKLLESARPEESTIHPCYEWDDNVAAEKYRERQSLEILSQLAVVRDFHEDNQPEAKIITRAYFNVSATNTAENHFANSERVMTDQELRRMAFKRILQDLSVYKKKLRNFKELEKVYGEIVEVEKKYDV